MASQFVDNEIRHNKVVVFSKSYCPYCKMAKQALDEVKAEYVVHELDKLSDGSSIQGYLAKITGASTVPRVFINGKCIGGGSETKALQNAGQLENMVKS